MGKERRQKPLFLTGFGKSKDFDVRQMLPLSPIGGLKELNVTEKFLQSPSKFSPKEPLPFLNIFMGFFPELNPWMCKQMNPVCHVSIYKVKLK